MLNIIGSTIAEQKSILTRLSELAEQSANGVYSSEQRDAMNNEYQALVKEFGRIAESTEFNGQKLLLGGRGDNALNFAIQAGIDGDVNSIINLLAGDTGSFSGSVYYTNDFITAGAGSYDPPPDGVGDIDDVTALFNLRSSGGSFEEISSFFGQTLLSYEVQDSNGELKNIYGSLYLLGGQVAVEFWEETSEGVYELVTGGNSFTTQALQDDFTTLNLTFNDSSTATLSLDLRGLDLYTGVGNAGDQQSSIEFTGVETADRSLAALTRLDKRLNELSQIEGRLGAVQSRLETARNVVDVSRENYLSAESRIRDADIAEESSNLTRLGILQQASSAVLAQANLQPSLALSLLG
jgi:flagellin